MSQTIPDVETGRMLQPVARLRVIGLLGEVLSISLANLPVLLTLSFLVGFPLMLASSPWGRSSAEQFFGLTLLGYMTWNLRSGFALHLVAAAQEGRRVPLAKSFQVGVEEALGAVKVAAVGGAIVWLAFMITVVPGMFAAQAHPMVFRGAMLLFTLFAIWLGSVFGVSVPLAILEKTSVLESLRRSARMSRGQRWPIALLLAVFAGLDLGAHGLLSFVSAAPGTVEFARHIVLIVAGALGAPILPVVYFHLRRDQESRSVEALAAVFD
jgi:hypothetical protein